MRNQLASFALGAALCGVGTADESLNTPTGENSSAPVVAATRAMRSAGAPKVVLTPEVAGVSLIADSVARPLLSEVSVFWQRGRVAPDDKVTLLLTHARLERGTEITPERMRAIIKQHPSDDVRLAVLRYMYEAHSVLVSDGTLSQFLTSKNHEALTYAMLCRSKDIGHAAPVGFFTPYLKHSELSVRSAAVVASLAAMESIPGTLGASEAFVGTRYLNAEQFTAGLETRLAKLMCESLKAKVGDAELVKELPYLGMPLMHLLQRIDAAAPGYLDAVIREGPGVFDEFCIQCAAFLKQKRAEIPDQIILSKESRGVVALHYEISFSPEPATDIFSLVGAQKPHIVKGGILPNGAAGFAAGETASYQTSSARQEYLKEVDALRSSEPKEKYLRLLKEATADPDTLCLVWHLMHGGPEHSWFYHGTPGTQRAPDQMRHPHAVSYVELAEALFTAQVERDQKGETLSFGHVTVILDACQQYTMAEGTLRELDRLALRAGRTIKSFPTIVALSQPLMYGFMNVAVVERSSNPGVDKRSAIEVADALVSPLFSPLVLKARETGELTVRDLIAAEVKAVDSFQLLLQDSKRLSVTADSSVITGSEVDAKGRRLLNAQDPSVFGSAPCSLLEVLEYVRSQSLREGITIPAFQNRETLARPSYLEISMRGTQAHSCSYS